MGAPTAKLETVVIVSPFKINALISALISSVLLLISLLTDYWLTATDVKQGLWRNCTLASSLPSLAYSIRAANDMNNFFICVPINKVLWIQICGGLVVVALVCGLIGAFLIGLGFSHKKRQERKMRYYSATIFVYIVGAICLLVSLVVFPLMFLRESHYRGKEKWYFGWSYGVAWGAVIFLLGAALLVMCDRNREEVFYRERLYLNQDDEENVEANQEAKIKTLR